MRPNASSFLLVAAAAFALAACGPRPTTVPPPPPVDPKWADDVGDLPFVVGLEAGAARAAETGRPPMYYFTATWCGYCKQMAATAFKDADSVAGVTAGFTPVLVDGDDPANAELATKFRVQMFPTIVFADAKGEARETVAGADVAGFKAAVARLTE